MSKPIRILTTTGVSSRDMIDMLIAQGALTVTRCPDGRRTNLDPKRGGGMMPGHLNPLTIGETREEVEAHQREQARA